MEKMRVPCGPYLPTKQLERQELKKIYKAKRAEDRKVGLQINELTQLLMHFQRERLDPKDPRVQSTFKELVNLRREGRFRHEFPSFASFKKFVKQNEMTLEDLREE